MSMLMARLRCWRSGHDWYLMTTDERVAGCHRCPKQSYGAAVLLSLNSCRWRSGV